MNFDEIIGQHRAKSILLRTLDHQRMAHAYLFSGIDGVGKEALALAFAQAILCSDSQSRPCGHCSHCRRVHSFQHPDLKFVFPSSAASVADERAVLDSVILNPYRRTSPWAAPTISIDQIRELRRMAALKPLEGKHVVIIAEADKMTIPAANSLLKLLEEPPESMIIILTASAPSTMLSTILSRCQEIRLGPLSDQDIEKALMEKEGIEPERAAVFARISQGSYRRALEWMDESLNEMRDEAVNFLRFCFKDIKSQLELIETLTQRGDKRYIKDMLTLMLLWFRDALFMLQHAAKDNQLINVDQRTTLERFTGAFESIQFDAVFIEIEKAVQMIERNIQVNLVLIVLMRKLKNNMILKGRST
ncbi:MAG: DNA polymerase III subunit delta' [Calditrichaeota bacterium]|nr:MAG: DNA polymerase III subunit delta' [Calditrichota bacterium]